MFDKLTDLTKIRTTIFLGIVISLFWYKSLNPLSQAEQNFSSIVAIVCIFICLFFRKKTKNEFEPIRITLLTGSIFILIFNCWSAVFRWYSGVTTFKGNIFRGAFDGFRAPFYGHSKILETNWMQILAVIIFILLLYYFSILIKTTTRFKFFIFFSFSLLILSFSWNDSLMNTFLSSNCHYATFASDLNKFHSVFDILKDYTKQIGTLSVHNNHYPPGTLILLKIEQLYVPYFLKSIVFITTLLSLIPLEKLLNYLRFDQIKKFCAYFLFISSGIILFYPGITVSSMELPLSIYGFYYLLKAMETKQLNYILGFSFIIILYLSISFIVLTYLLFCAVFLLLQLYKKELDFKHLLVFTLINLFTISGFYGIIFLFTEFNLIECFVYSLKNEKIQMHYSGIDNWSRYFIVSTGNVIAFVGMIGLPVLGLLFYSYRQKNIPKHLLGLIYSLLITIFILGFSNQFYLEVERIWVFLSPFILLVAAWVLGDFYLKKVNLLFFFLLVNILTTLWFKFNIDHCY